MTVAGGVVGTNFEFGAEFGGGGFEIALTQVNQANEIVGLGKIGIDLQSGPEFGERVRIVFLLGIGLAEKKMYGWIVGILLKQDAEDLRGLLGLPRSNEGGAPGKEQARIVRRRLEKRLEDFTGLRKIVGQKIAHAEKLADKVVVRRSSELALE